MYLEKRIYVKNWSHNPKKDEVKISVKKGAKKHPNIDTSKVSYIIEEAGYWRKANAIHAWFVEHCGKGNDDCNPYWVSSEDLKDLLDRCNQIIEGCKLVKGKVANGQRMVKGKWVNQMEDGKVMTNSELAHELLPTQEGFFFGGTDYNEWYMNDIIETKKIVEEALKSIEVGAEIYYQASW